VQSALTCFPAAQLEEHLPRETMCYISPKLSSLTSEGGTKHKPARFENTENNNPFNSPLSKTTWARLYHSSLTSCFSHYYTTPVNILLHFLQSTVTFRVHGKLKVQNSSTFQGLKIAFFKHQNYQQKAIS